jgi:hypothetical protein
MAQLLAITACSSYFTGMEPVNETYETREYERELAAIKARTNLR